MVNIDVCFFLCNTVNAITHYFYYIFLGFSEVLVKRETPATSTITGNEAGGENC